MKCPICENEKNNKKHVGVYIQCCICKSLHVEQLPDKELIQRQADIDANIMLTTHNTLVEPIHHKRLKELSRYIPKKSKILDVGSGEGIFLQYVKQEGYLPVAMDISAKLIQHMKKDGIEGYSDIKDVPSRKFAAVTSFDVIEHTPNPQIFLTQIKDKLKKNAVIMLTTPNATGISARVMQQHWWVFGPDAHLVLLTPQSMKYLLEKQGFEIIQLKTNSFTQWFVPSNNFIKSVVNKILYLLFFFIRNFAYTHNLGDNIEVIARANN
jgi:2-polyprenyl-3-methyl-5-hydroxy-6-metoxy-1,4-benzoquinol methylase